MAASAAPGKLRGDIVDVCRQLHWDWRCGEPQPAGFRQHAVGSVNRRRQRDLWLRHRGGMRLSPPVGALRRRSGAISLAQARALSSPITSAGRRTAAATSLVVDDDDAQILALDASSTMTVSQNRARTDRRRLPISRMSTRTPPPCSPRAGLTTTRACRQGSRATLFRPPASTCSGRRKTASPRMRQVCLSSQRLGIAIAVVGIPTAISRQTMLRPPISGRK